MQLLSGGIIHQGKLLLLWLLVVIWANIHRVCTGQVALVGGCPWSPFVSGHLEGAVNKQALAASCRFLGHCFYLISLLSKKGSHHDDDEKDNEPSDERVCDRMFLRRARFALVLRCECDCDRCRRRVCFFEREHNSTNKTRKTHNNQTRRKHNNNHTGEEKFRLTKRDLIPRIAASDQLFPSPSLAFFLVRSRANIR